jgi:hypothetical protein
MAAADIYKLLVIEFLKGQVSAKFAKKCRQKMDVADDAELPDDHPTFMQVAIV